MTDQAKERMERFTLWRCLACGNAQTHEFLVHWEPGNRHPCRSQRIQKVGLVPASALEERDRVLGAVRAFIEKPSRLDSVALDQLRSLVALARTKEGGEPREPGAVSDFGSDETRPTLSPSEPCPECDGKGRYIGRGKAWPDTLCSTCHGTGKAPSDNRTDEQRAAEDLAENRSNVQGVNDSKPWAQLLHALDTYRVVASPDTTPGEK